MFVVLGYGFVIYEWLVEYSGLFDDVLYGVLFVLELVGCVVSVVGGCFVWFDVVFIFFMWGVLYFLV